MKRIAIAAAVLAVLVLSGCAAAEAPRSEASSEATSPSPSPVETASYGEITDENYLVAMEYQWPEDRPTDDDLIELGEAVCAELDAGADDSAVVVVTNADGSTHERNANVVTAAEQFLCPEHFAG